MTTTFPFNMSPARRNAPGKPANGPRIDSAGGVATQPSTAPEKAPATRKRRGRPKPSYAYKVQLLHDRLAKAIATIEAGTAGPYVIIELKSVLRMVLDLAPPMPPGSL